MGENIISDLHIHSRYSRACSKNIDIENLEKYARIKGVNLLGTGDFTHPLWLNELKSKLKEDGSGILKTANGFNFILSSEVSNIYLQDNKLRKVHNLILAKSFEIVEQINELFKNKGKLESDGRPIFGKYPCYEMAEDLKKIDKAIEIIPCHVLTPWFSIFGSMSGFDSVEECFKDQTKNIFALETGMSADPEMIWRVDNWSKFSLISNSDSHSFWPWRLGREANIFDVKLSYDDLINAIRTREGFKETIEVDPGYGKYHFDGHRVCGICMKPSDSIKNKNMCPKCGRKLIIGVLNRVELLANHEEGYKPKNAIDFKRLIPLSELIGSVYDIKQLYSKNVWSIYNKLIEAFGNEFKILLDVSFEELKKVVHEKLAKVIIMNREGKLEIKPGYDGVYGEVVLNNEYKTKIQKTLTDF